jgi:anti-anti-sigma factor
MEISEKSVEGHTVIDLGGQIDSTASKEFEEFLVGVIDKGTHTMIVDFKNVKFISSAGLRVLLLAGKKVKPYGGKVILCNLSKDVREVFDISGFSTIFSIYSDLTEALQNSGS